MALLDAHRTELVSGFKLGLLRHELRTKLVLPLGLAHDFRFVYDWWEFYRLELVGYSVESPPVVFAHRDRLHE